MITHRGPKVVLSNKIHNNVDNIMKFHIMNLTNANTSEQEKQ